MGLGDSAGEMGRGLFAGAAGTVAMTISNTLEAKLRGRGSSSAPADAAGKVLGIQPRDEASEARFANVVHWAYGTSWGAVRGLLDTAGLNGPQATLAHFAAIWGGAQVMLPALDVAPPPWRSPPLEIAIDAWHHAVYATATGIAYTALDRDAR